MTIAALSKESGIAKSTLYDIETGRRNVKFTYVEKIAECLGVPIENMFYPTFYRTYINTE
ncbi:helix-turn-helix domain-containing protein [Bacillus cereus]